MIVLNLKMIYLKRANFRVYLFSRVEKNWISRELIFEYGHFEKISRVLIFTNHEKETFFKRESPVVNPIVLAICFQFQNQV